MASPALAEQSTWGVTSFLWAGSDLRCADACRKTLPSRFYLDSRWRFFGYGHGLNAKPPGALARMFCFLASHASIPIRKKLRCTPEPKSRKLNRLECAIGRCLAFPNRLDAAILAQGTGRAPSNLDSESVWTESEEAEQLGTDFEVVATCAS